MPLLRTRWFPVLMAVLVAELNFWYFVSTGENEADYLGVALFGLFAFYGIAALVRRAPRRGVVSVAGALAAAGLMLLRESGTWGTEEAGYILPYAVFILGVLLGPL